MSFVSDFATENYLKAIVKTLSENGHERMTTGEISRTLGVTPGTVTSMAKKLEKTGYVLYESRRGCRLTEKGRNYGIRMLRRHRLLELFLANSLALDWSEVHEEAESLEHAVSDRLIDLIDDYLGHPDRDPHGDIIPGKNQHELRTSDVPLNSISVGSSSVVSRVEGEAGVLAYYRNEGLVPGAAVTVLSNRPEAGLVNLRISQAEKLLAASALDGVFVET